MTIQSPSRRLRLSILSLSLFCSGAAVAAQSEQTKVGPPNVRVLAAHWFMRKVPGGPFPRVNTDKTPTENEGRTPTEPPETIDLPRPDRVYVYSIELLNTGPKDISRLSWTYWFLDSENPSRKGFSGHHVHTIRVNEKKTLEVTSKRLPSKVINVAGPNVEERVMIDCLLFTDGTAWQNPKAIGRPCDTLRKIRKD